MGGFAYLEVWLSSGLETRPIDTERLTIGKSRTNDLMIDGDPAISRLHAVVERIGGAWCLRDLGSRNSTFVNGERVTGERVLHPGDEIRLGSTRLVFRADPTGFGTTATQAAVPAPDLTRREREVLVELCRPLLTGSLFTEPASIRAIAARLVVSDATVKQHLSHLYMKFAIDEGGERRRVRLANDAITRGAVAVADMRDESP